MSVTRLISLNNSVVGFFRASHDKKTQQNKKKSKSKFAKVLGFCFFAVCFSLCPLVFLLSVTLFSFRWSSAKKTKIRSFFLF